MEHFPSNFILGVSTSAYQIEGAWNKDGRGENFWDRLIHTQPHLVRDGSNADIACDSYHKYQDDIRLIKDIGFSAYKFSISWSRVLPDGIVTNINKPGIEYYNNVVNELIKNNITPVVCLYHYDLPQKLQDIGGWCNTLMVDYFADYAKLMFQTLGDRVKYWMTINEPTEEVHGYVDRRYAPYLSLECLDGHYIVVHNMIKAHARAYRIYEKEFKASQKGQISIILAAWFFKSKTESEEDKEAAQRAQLFTTGWVAHPIFSENGDYPEVMRRLLDEKSQAEGKPRSKLPQFTREEIEEIKGSCDFMTINHYTSALVSCNNNNAKTKTILQDANVMIEFDPSWPTGAHWSRTVPWGMKGILCWIKQEYNNPAVYITENGYADQGDVNDTARISFHKEYLKEMLIAVHEHECNVIAYHVWSLLDNFEWLGGISCKYGLIKVNYNSVDRERTLKLSASFFRNLCRTRTLTYEQ